MRNKELDCKDLRVTEKGISSNNNAEINKICWLNPTTLPAFWGNRNIAPVTASKLGIYVSHNQFSGQRAAKMTFFQPFFKCETKSAIEKGTLSLGGDTVAPRLPFHYKKPDLRNVVTHSRMEEHGGIVQN